MQRSLQAPTPKGSTLAGGPRVQPRPSRLQAVILGAASGRRRGRKPVSTAQGKAGGTAAAAAVGSAPAADPPASALSSMAVAAESEAARVQPKEVSPEDFQAPSGQLLPINKLSPPSPADVYRCIGCTKPECQGPNGCAAPDMAWRNKPDGYLKNILTAKVYKIAVETPLQEAQQLSKQLGNTIMLKREDLQPVRSFKVRGAFNRMSRLTPEQLAIGVVCSSAGNHAQGVALAAKTLGCKAVICMPTNSPEIKVNAVKELGGIVKLVGESFYEAQFEAQKLAEQDGLTFIHAYDDPFTCAGQGTMGLEILRESETLDGDLDIIFVSIGGGGMIAGIAAVVKALNPKIQVIGVEPAGANAMCQSLVRGERVVLSKVDAFADGVAIKLPGAEPFRLCRELLDGVVMVDNGAIATALKDVFNETRTILEPAGAVALAGAKAYLQYYGLKGKRVVAVTSGSNMNFDRLRLVSELVDIGSVETMLAATIPEQKGAIVQLLEMASGPDGTPFDVTEFEFRSFDAGRGGTARVLLGLGVSPGTKACRAMMDKFAQTEGYAITDISDMDLAQTHLRHMVGGPALQSDGAPVQDERIFKVDYREQVGMLRKLLTPLSPRWDVTLLHFRKTGNRFATALLGLRIPDDEMEEFEATLEQFRSGMEREFVFTPLSDRERDVFSLFI
ncbi:threonine deaminase isoform A [Chlorella sorokiniana]|uniref:Threonine dehydratase n=1 Tax=Chlorella sorokiniana TaxID=3076 RepID=A0A2P6TIM8_CHLSO|nr:threonine deaminase isoform A [Chlorella sorokiniana]|eukprot:PRW39107.1 threonine deaminase isoform A [Chlorella sorokiniana]